jgi:hypothetical protein
MITVSHHGELHGSIKGVVYSDADTVTLQLDECSERKHTRKWSENLQFHRSSPQTEFMKAPQIQVATPVKAFKLQIQQN